MTETLHTIKDEKHRHRLFAKRPTQIATKEFDHLPLHVQNPPVEFLSWTKADALMKLAANNSNETVWFESTLAYRNEDAAKKIFNTRLSSEDVIRDAKINDSDLKQLVESKFALDSGMTVDEFESSFRNSFAYVQLFSVVESKPEGDRRRVIAWPRSLNFGEQLFMRNLLETKNAKVIFSNAVDIRNLGATKKYAASLDFKKFFQQFELIIKRFWAFKFKDRVFFLSSIPTGAVFPPLFAQALSSTIAALSVRKTAVTATVFHDGCIDNLRLCSDSLDDLWVAWSELISLCDHLQITIGESIPPPTSNQKPYVYLGMFFDNSTVQLSEKSKNKISNAIALINSRVPVLVVDVLAIFGQTVWACTVTDFKLGHLYHVIKFIRRTQRKPLHDFVSIWPSIIQEWTTALECMMTRKFQPAEAPTKEVTMYSDASKTGWGVVVLDFGSQPIRVFAGQWSKIERQQHINELELRALRIGIRHLASLNENSSTKVGIRVFIDNTSARAWAQKMRSPKFSTNQLAMEIASLVEDGNLALLSIDYVQSASNLADAASRLYT